MKSPGDGTDVLSRTKFMTGSFSLRFFFPTNRAKAADVLALCPTINVVTIDIRKPTRQGSRLEQL